MLAELKHRCLFAPWGSHTLPCMFLCVLEVGQSWGSRQGTVQQSHSDRPVLPGCYLSSLHLVMNWRESSYIEELRG